MNTAPHGVFVIGTHTHKLVCMYYSNTKSCWVEANLAHGLNDMSTFGHNGGICTSSWSPQVYVNVCVHVCMYVYIYVRLLQAV